MRVTGHGGRLVVYSVLTGSHAHLANPFPPGCRGFERICFTDDPDLSSDDWSIVRMDPALLDPERESRRPKILLTASCPISTSASTSTERSLSKSIRWWPSLHVLDGDSSFACFRHPWRDCVYAEGEEVIRVGYDRETRVREQLDFNRSTGFPDTPVSLRGRCWSDDTTMNTSSRLARTGSTRYYGFRSEINCLSTTSLGNSASNTRCFPGNSPITIGSIGRQARAA